MLVRQLSSRYNSRVLHRSFSAQAKLLDPGIKVEANQLFINGKYVDALSGSTMPSLDPRDESVICQVAEAQAEDVDLAVKAARDAFDSGVWSTKSGFYRSKILHKWADKLEENLEYVARLETWDNGKPLAFSKLDLHFCIEHIRYFAGWADKIQGKTLPNNDVLGKYFSYTLHEPKGVVASITPWNFPLLMFVWQAAPALACGNSMVAKVAETTPLTSLYNAQLMSEAGVPDGVVNVVPGLGPTAGHALAAHPGVNKVSFTGSGPTGRDVMISAAENLTSVTLELGGKSPAIIFDDANIDNAVNQLQVGLFLNQGQCCCASSRIYAHEKVYDEFVEKTLAATSKRKVGDPFGDVDQGPQQNRRQFDKVLDYLNKGKQGGAKVLHGGNRIGDKGYFVESTVFGDVKDDMEIAKDEIFGPVMQIMKFNDAEDVIRRANNTTYGLAAGVFSENINTCNAVSRALKAGTVWVNCYDVFDASVPFGGYKQSGFGRVKSEYAIENFTSVKCVTQLLPNDGGWYN
eukprot:CAMPEP_0197021440 /NCGR_PEP_ID=MMETSP1384-20130603/2320_1 /TAXON_ID=29189 /ORGANISM="Ammonia sp." /LENGTH=517 /DNA_ID=CAMNT_0042449267 /DNA_START=32 /DNA_END=1585 /DNA_ORIENTATION=+